MSLFLALFPALPVITPHCALFLLYFLYRRLKMQQIAQGSQALDAVLHPTRCKVRILCCTVL
jgi:hypothetical protein